MRIVLVTHFYPAHGGGIELVAAQLARRMAAAGDEIVWCASDSDASPILSGVQCEPMRGWHAIERASGFPYPLWHPSSLKRLADCVRHADAVHVHDCIYLGSLAAGLLARRLGKPLAVTQHIGAVPLPMPLRLALTAANRLGARWVLRPAIGVAFISPAVRRHFESLSGACPRWHDVANGVDTSVFGPGDAPAQQLRTALGFDPQRPLLLFVGRFSPKKRLPLVREMAAATPQWQWCVIGQGPEAPQAWGLPNVRVLPFMAQAELAAHYRAADLLVLPSQGEGFPLVVQEAMACGLPACITAEVAAGSTMPADLWLELPDVPGHTAPLGVQVIDAWIGRAESEHRALRAACAQFAASHWDWNASAQTHRRWLHGSTG